MSHDFRARLKRGDKLLGTMVTLACPSSTEILSNVGFDWLFVDGEHGPLETGELLALLQAIGGRAASLVRVPEGNEVAIKKVLDLGADGAIHVLTRIAHVAPGFDPERPILEDFVSVLDPASGVELRRVSLLASLLRSRWRELLIAREGDLFHTNGIEVLDGRLAARLPAFAAGNVLVSIPTLDALAVVDLDAEAIVWLLRGEFRAQHDPRVLGNGNLLVFDNQGLPGASRALELDPATGETRWSYRGDAADPFFSLTCGSAQRLDNGNTLLTESDAGRALEVRPDGEIVWEYASPHRAGEQRELVATLFEVERLPPGFGAEWIADEPRDACGKVGPPEPED